MAVKPDKKPTVKPPDVPGKLYTLIKMPQDKAVLTIAGHLHVTLPYKPNWFHRFWQRVLLGFKWKDR